MKHPFRTASISCGVVGLIALCVMAARGRQRRPLEADIDDTLDASFPASDPPAWSGITRADDPVPLRH